MKKVIRRILIILAAVVAALVLVVGGYVLYMVLQYSRIPDNTALKVENGQTQRL